MSHLLAQESQMLPAAPQDVLDAKGWPRFGRYAGTAQAIDWSRLASPYARNAAWRHFHHKRWQYIALATDDLFCGIAIVDLGWTSTAFAYAFDRRAGREVAGFSQDGLPGIGARVASNARESSAFHLAGKHIDWQPFDGGYRLALRGPGFAIDAELDARSAAPPLLAVGPIEHGSVHATQKSSGMPLKGTARIGAEHRALDGGVGSFDYSNGLLARETQWSWASAHSLTLGFNLQAGYFGSNENALWLDGKLIPLGAAHFLYDAIDPLKPWHVRTDDGLLDLAFQPEGARREDKNLLVAASRYVQPIGSFSGWVRPHRDAPRQEVVRLAGVTEDHTARW
jgi:Protein of unknown function (DUF2804)